MTRRELHTWRQGPQIAPDITRVLLKPFVPGDDERKRKILKRVSTIGDRDAQELLQTTLKEFAHRHRDIEGTFDRRYEDVKHLLTRGFKPSPAQRRLIGSYFCCEYSLEAAALFNPSIVPHPDQSGVPAGSLRYVMSLRATGEGHISSIEFRSGLVDAEGGMTLDPPGPIVSLGRTDVDPTYEREDIELGLDDEGCLNATTRAILKPLGDRFTRAKLRARIAGYRQAHRRLSATREASVAWLESLADTNYVQSFTPDQPLSERAIFPASPLESNGIEDGRFVRFVDETGLATYYATYTAYNGRAIRPLLLETTDFLRFRVRSLTGDAARNKGMALFPRRVKGKYAMISRQDAESLYLVYSDRMIAWDAPRVLLKPTFDWEFMQIGNCGSPIEMPEGWLLLTHGVGPVRKYCIGAILLDKEDPSRIVKRLREPLIAPDADERNGYVPNVVYTCGALTHGDRLVIPYAMSDYATRMSSVSVRELLAAMVSSER